MKYYCDTNRHLICVPYSRENLHIMAKELNINKCWFHPNPDHYDIPLRRIDEIMKKCTIITTKELVKIVKKSENINPAWINELEK